MIAAALLLALQSPARAPNLSVFKPFIGACWRTEFTATMHDTHCFEAMFGGAHVLDRHEVKEGDKTVYAGETVYSADGPDLVFTYFNSLGGMGIGKVGSADRMLGFTGTMRASPDKAEQPIDSEWRLIDVDHYEVRSLVPTTEGKAAKPHVFTKLAPTHPQ